MIRVGVVGYGLSGRVFHAPMIAAVEGLELAAVVERNSRNAEQTYPSITTYTSLTDLLKDATIDLIVIGTPNQTHVPLATEALTAGRHVVVDKPVAVTSTKLTGLINLAKASARLLIPYHNRRWDSDFQTIQKLLHEQTLGNVVSLESTFDRWRPRPSSGVWREDVSLGGGTLLDLGTHLADQALVLFGLPEAVSAEVVAEREGVHANDAFTIRLRYPGKTITLSGNCLAALPRPRYTIRGTKGNYVKWGLDSQEARLKAMNRVMEPGWGIEAPETWGTLAAEVDEKIVAHTVEAIPGDYRLYYAGVRDAILGKSAPPVAALDALRVARLLEWAVESSDQRREVTCDWQLT